MQELFRRRLSSYYYVHKDSTMMQWYPYLCLQLLPFAVSQVLPPGLPNCAYKCANLLTLPGVLSCSDNLEKAVPCICQNSELLTSAAQCAMSACPLSVITENWPKYSKICSSVGVVIDNTYALQSTTLIMSNITATTTRSADNTSSISTPVPNTASKTLSTAATASKTGAVASAASGWGALVENAVYLMLFTSLAGIYFVAV